MKPTHRLILFATIFAIIFTTMVYLTPKYKGLWFSLEVIVLPLIYYVGYEMLMDKQKEEFVAGLRLERNK